VYLSWGICIKYSTCVFHILLLEFAGNITAVDQSDFTIQWKV